MAQSGGFLVRFGVAVITLCLSFPAFAALKVIESSVPSVEIGAVLTDETIIDVPKDAKVTVMKTEECRALEIKGPYHGKIADYLQQKRGIWTGARELWKKLTGGSSGDASAPVGGTRGVRSTQACN